MAEEFFSHVAAGRRPLEVDSMRQMLVMALHV